MSSRLEMLQVARLAPRLLGESAEAVRAFVLSQYAGGGFLGRDGKPDLYYTVFGVDCLTALQADVPPIDLASPPPSSLVEMACLARLKRIDAETVRGAAVTSVYDAFLYVGALQDLAAPIERAGEVAALVHASAAPGGGYATAPGTGVATTPTTAAAVTVLRQLGERAADGTAEWLAARASPRGGFVAAPATPVPDLLSTAVALHALSGLAAPIERFREPCLDFVDSLWTARGGFYGHWAETVLDCEYTFYGLLALGHLTV